MRSLWHCNQPDPNLYLIFDITVEHLQTRLDEFHLSWAETENFGSRQTYRSPCPPLAVQVVIGVSVGVATVAFPIACVAM